MLAHLKRASQRTRIGLVTKLDLCLTHQKIPNCLESKKIDNRKETGEEKRRNRKRRQKRRSGEKKKKDKTFLLIRLLRILEM